MVQGDAERASWPFIRLRAGNSSPDGNGGPEPALQLHIRLQLLSARVRVQLLWQPHARVPAMSPCEPEPATGTPPNWQMPRRVRPEPVPTHLGQCFRRCRMVDQIWIEGFQESTAATNSMGEPVTSAGSKGISRQLSVLTSAADHALTMIGIPRKECSKAGDANPLNGCRDPREHFCNWVFIRLVEGTRE